MFDALRHWAYRQSQPENQDQWQRAVLEQGWLWYSRIPNRRDFPESEIHQIAYSVSEWTWGQSFRKPAPNPKLQALRGQCSGQGRRDAVLERDLFIIGRHADGLSYRAIAREVAHCFPERACNHQNVAYVVKRGIL